MIPVTPRHATDCAAAALAAILELPIEEMPDFWNKTSDGLSMFEAIRRWLAPRGYHWFYTTCEPVQLETLKAMPRRLGLSWPPRGYWLAQIASVAALRDHEARHLVVMKDRRCVFNPNGKPADLLAADEWLVGFYLLVPLNPAA